MAHAPHAEDAAPALGHVVPPFLGGESGAEVVR